MRAIQTKKASQNGKPFIGACRPKFTSGQIDKYNLAPICIETQHNWAKIIKVFKFSVFGQAYLNNPFCPLIRIGQSSKLNPDSSHFLYLSKSNLYKKAPFFEVDLSFSFNLINKLKDNNFFLKLRSSNWVR